MPRRLDNDQVRQKFIAAGYVPDNDFNYKNNKQKHRVYDILNNKFVKISLQTLDYNIKKGHRPLWEEPPLPTLPEDEQQPQQSSNTPLDRFIRSHNKQESFQQLPREIQQQTFDSYQQLRHSIMSKRNFTYNFDNNHIVHHDSLFLRGRHLLPKASPPHFLREKLLKNIS